MATCGQCGRENSGDARFCSGCGAPLGASAPERRKLATLLFCDLSGSTALGERADPETVRDIMTRYFMEAREAIERHGGTVEKFVGDAVMAVFGVPVAHEDDALRAVRAATEMGERLANLNSDLERRYGSRIALRMGLNTGEVVTGDATSVQMLVTGDAVNVAARLEQHARPGEILLGAATYRLVRDAVEADPVEPIAARGKSQPVPAYRLHSVIAGAPTRARRLDIGMVGRDRELALLRQAFDEAVASQSCRRLVVVGHPGVGKSRLASELLRSLGSEATVVGGRCLSYGEGITYWPLRDVVKQAAGIRDEDSADEALERISALVAREERGGAIALALAQAVGLLVGSASADEIGWAARKLFEALGREGPLVVHLDDLHWAEPTFLDLVEDAVELSTGAPLLLLCLARPELLEVRPSWEALRLTPLGEAESMHLLERLLGKTPLAATARARVIERAEGNPLFVEELVAMLLEDPGLEVPETLDALLGARLDRLADGERAAADRGSVEGQAFHRSAVEELSDRSEGVAQALDGLVAKELIEPTQAAHVESDAFRFRHILIRDAVYRSMPKRLRAELHERFARWLERVAGGRVTEYEEFLGYHLEQAYRYRAELGALDDAQRAVGAAAAKWLVSAAHRAFARGDMRAAANLLGRAASLVEDDAAARLEVLPELAKALRYSGDMAAADKVLSEAVEVSAAVGDRRLQTRVAVESAFLTLYTDPEVETADVIRSAEHAAEIFTELGDELGLAKAWSLVGHAAWLLCRGEKMEEAFERALLHMRRAGDPRERWWILTQLLCAAVFGPAPPERGIQRCNDLLALGEGVRSLEMTAAAAIGSLEAVRGNFGTAREAYAHSRSIGEELGLKRWLGALANFSGPIELLAGDFPAAERELRLGFETLQSLGELGTLSTTAAMLSRAIVLQGRYEEAERFAAVSERAASRDDLFSQVVWRGTCARAQAHRGELEQAEALAREAAAMARTTDFLNLQGEALLDLADVLGTAGKDEEAVNAIHDALPLFEAKGCTVLAGRARALLDPVARVELQS
jgi:class 3 adenylate cyclase/tetratricopeptide (TPR) repeat protein